jgi:hypothetical protein
MLTREQIQQNIEALEKQGASQSEIQEWLNTLPKPKPVQEQPQKRDGFISTFGNAVKNQEPQFKASEGGAGTLLPNIAKTFGNIPSSAVNLGRAIVAPVNPFDTEHPLNIGSNIVKGAQALSGIVKDRGVVQGAKDVVGGFVDTGKGVLNSISTGAKNAWQNPAQAVSDVAKVGIEDPLLIPSLLYGGQKVVADGAGDAIAKIARPVTRGTDTSLSKIGLEVGDLAKRLTTKSEKQIESTIVNRFEKGVKPTLPSRANPRAVADYRDDIVQAVKTINENKPNLSLSDEVGEKIAGQNPKTLQQLSEAIEQTKKSIFTKYDDLATQAGEAGLKVDLKPIADELDGVIQNRALEITSPSSIKYAEELKDRLIKNGRLDAKTTQDVIQNYNKSLEAFYRNPNYDTASKAAIDAMIANRMRQALDEGINGLTGAQYGALKQQYGALKTVERDVIKAALRDARRNTKGLIDFTDVLSGGDVVNGLLTLNPGLIAKGATQKAIATFYKYLNDPNRAIEKMFIEIENLPVK